MNSNIIIITLALALLPLAHTHGQTEHGSEKVLTDTITTPTDSAVTPTDTAAVDTNKPTGRPGAKKWEGPAEEKIYFISGFCVSADMVGLVMKAAGSTFSQLEIAGRLNIREKIFPIFELGLAEGNRVGNSKDNVFHTSADRKSVV